MTTTVDVRQRLALALDVDDFIEARRMSRELRSYFDVVRVGLELFTAVGPDVVSMLREQGYEVLLDLKLHDEPATVERAARVLGALGASYLTLHAFGGVTMMRAAVEGATEGALRAELEAPKTLAVTILTSDFDAPPHILGNRVRTSMEAGCSGLVCTVGDIKEAKLLAPRAFTMVSNVRPAGVPVNDPRSDVTVASALDEGADLVVVGRAVTGADDRVKAAEELLASLS